jgi:putative hydrolase of the HAD superfamily
LKNKTGRFSGVAFDLDGTLYPNYSFYIRLVPFLLREQRYLRAFGKARNRLHQESGLQKEEQDVNTPSFYQRQAEYMAEILKKESKFLKERTDKLIYRGWEPLFKKVKLFPHVKETLTALRERGIKLGLLSDFPPETKIENLGLSEYWDTILCSEKIGQLKPDPLPFKELCRAMALPPDKILYVGNSFPYDILGAQRAGMKTAWKRPFLWNRFQKKGPGSIKKSTGNVEKADFVFYDYRQLSTFVIT